MSPLKKLSCLAALLFAASCAASLTAAGDDSPSPARRGIREIYIVQLAHLDIGFTAPPGAVAKECKARIDQVLKFLDRDSRFRWTVESIWQIEQWLARTPEEAKRKKLFAYVKAGRMAIGAGFANMHSSMMGPEEMNRFFYPAHRIRKAFGVPIETAFIDDVPGWSFAFPQAMAKSGVRYLVTGPNLFVGGAARIPPAKRPFWFEGPDGSRVLAWMGAGAYLEGAFNYGLHGSRSRMEEAVTARIKEWEDAGYPFDAILVLDGTGDNGMADNALKTLDNVDWWNEGHAVRMILATPRDFFRHMEETYPSGAFPVYAGDSAGLWAGTVDCNDPASQAMVRKAKDRIFAAEEMEAVDFLEGEACSAAAGRGGDHSAAPGGSQRGVDSPLPPAAAGPHRGPDYPAAAIDDVYRGLLRFDEHSGAGAGWPGKLLKAEVDKNNRTRFEEALSVHRASRILLDGGIAALARRSGAAGPALFVFNPLSWERTDTVRVEIPESFRGAPFLVRDGVTHAEVPCSIRKDGAVAFIAENVPPVGFKIFRLEKTGTAPRYPDRVLFSAAAGSLENFFYRVSIGPKGLSILDKEAGRELVNEKSDFTFCGLIRANNKEDFLGLYDRLPFGEFSASGSSGPVRGEMVLDFADSPRAKIRILLYEGIKRIEIENTLDKTRMPFVPYAKHSEHYSLCFPFALDVSRGFRALVENPNVLLDPGADKLPGAFAGSFVSGHAIDLREAGGFGVTLANRESFINEIGNPFHHAAAFAPKEATVINKAVQKIDQGKTKDRGAATVTSIDGGVSVLRFRHALTSSPPPRENSSPAVRIAAIRFGWSFDIPLEAAFIPGEPDEQGEKGGIPSAPDEQGEKSRSYAASGGHGGENPVPAAPAALQDGATSAAKSFFSLSRGNVILTAVKKAEFGGEGDIVFRVLEIAGIPSKGVKLESSFPFSRAWICSILEEPAAGGSIEADPVTFDINAREVLTIRARL